MKVVIVRVCSMQLHSRLLVDEEMLELIEGKYSKLDGGLRAASGKALYPTLKKAGR